MASLPTLEKLMDVLYWWLLCGGLATTLMCVFLRGASLDEW